MKSKFLRRALCLVLSVLILTGSLGLPVLASTDVPEKDNGASAGLEDMRKYLDALPYSDYLALYGAVAPGKSTVKGEFLPDVSAQGAFAVTEDSWANLGLDPADYQEGIYLPSEGKVHFSFTVPEASGMFFIKLTYYSIDGSVNSVERKLYIDDAVPFAEASMITMSKKWIYEYERDEDGNRVFEKDVNGNDLTPEVAQKNSWMTYFCSDADGYSNDYYRFFFSEGAHTVTLESIREPIVLSSIELVPINDPAYAVPDYATYLERVQALGATDVTGSDATVTLQGEMPDFVSDSSVSMSNNKTSAITEPSVPGADLYNVIGANSYSAVGQWAAYDFTVSKTGLYQMSMRYQQSALDGMFVSRAVKLTSYGQGQYPYGFADGTPAVPFSEAYSLRYNYNKKWQSARLTDGETDFRFYFEAGVTYTVYFEVSLGALAAELQRVENALTKLNDCYLQILKITGSDPDKYRNYRFSDIIPDVIYYLNYEAVELQEVRDHFEAICGTAGSHLTTLDTVIRLVAEMGTDEDSIAGNLSNLKSYLGTLGTWISNSKVSSLTVDYITISAPETPLGKAEAGFFESIWFELVAFFKSFSTDYDKMGVTDLESVSDDALEVWLALGRDQSKVIRNMIDADFANFCEKDPYYDETLAVNLKLVTASTLLPSILAGKGPDVYMGLDSASTMNYAIREAVLPLTTDKDGQPLFDDYEEVTSHFHEAALRTTTIQGKNYGIPMTMNFPMMFYRQDFLVRIGEEVPETWDDIMGMLDALTKNNLDIGITYANAIEFFLYQYGGNMWKYTDDPIYQGAQIGLDTNEALAAFDYCCRLYTEYSFPVSFDAANRFRTGEMPIVIGDYVSTYNTLVVFATEIAGLWTFSSIPGTVRTVLNEQGEEETILDYTATVAITSAVITKSGEDRMQDAWQYIKWCTGADYTAEYANRMVALIGPSAKYAGANLDAIENMSWTTSEVRAIKDQMDHLAAVVNYPGYYIISRYTEFAFLAAVNEGEKPADAIRGYVDAINAEITRKREEFGMETLDPGETPPGYEDGTPAS